MDMYRYPNYDAMPVAFSSPYSYGMEAYGLGVDSFGVPGMTASLSQVEQAARDHVSAQAEMDKAKEKFDEAKKKLEDCEKKVKQAEDKLNYAKALASRGYMG